MTVKKANKATKNVQATKTKKPPAKIPPAAKPFKLDMTFDEALLVISETRIRKT